MVGVQVCLDLVAKKRRRMQLQPPPLPSDEQVRVLRANFGEVKPMKKKAARAA